MLWNGHAVLSDSSLPYEATRVEGRFIRVDGDLYHAAHVVAVEGPRDRAGMSVVQIIIAGVGVLSVTSPSLMKLEGFKRDVEEAMVAAADRSPSLADAIGGGGSVRDALRVLLDAIELEGGARR